MYWQFAQSFSLFKRCKQANDDHEKEKLKYEKEKGRHRKSKKKNCEAAEQRDDES